MDMEKLAQVGFFLAVLMQIEAQGGREMQFPFQSGRAAGPDGPQNERFYYKWMAPRHFPHPYPALNNFPYYGPQPQPFGQNVPLHFRNFHNTNHLPYAPHLNQFEINRDPTIILMPPNIPPVQYPTTENPQTTTSAVPVRNETVTESETLRETTTTATPNEESERSGELVKSATGGFTNAHHYPFPIGLWSQYKKSIGFDEPLQSVTTDEEEPATVQDPRRFPFVLLQPNQLSFVNTQRHFPDWSYGRPHSGAQFPGNLVRIADQDQSYDGRKITSIGDTPYQFFALPLRSVLNQINSEMENERV